MGRRPQTGQSVNKTKFELFQMSRKNDCIKKHKESDMSQNTVKTLTPVYLRSVSNEDDAVRVSESEGRRTLMHLRPHKRYTPVVGLSRRGLMTSRGHADRLQNEEDSSLVQRERLSKSAAVVSSEKQEESPVERIVEDETLSLRSKTASVSASSERSHHLERSRQQQGKQLEATPVLHRTWQPPSYSRLLQAMSKKSSALHWNNVMSLRPDRKYTSAFARQRRETQSEKKTGCKLCKAEKGHESSFPLLKSLLKLPVIEPTKEKVSTSVCTDRDDHVHANTAETSSTHKQKSCAQLKTGKKRLPKDRLAQHGGSSHDSQSSQCLDEGTPQCKDMTSPESRITPTPSNKSQRPNSECRNTDPQCAIGLTYNTKPASHAIEQASPWSVSQSLRTKRSSLTSIQFHGRSSPSQEISSVGKDLQRMDESASQDSESENEHLFASSGLLEKPDKTFENKTAESESISESDESLGLPKVHVDLKGQRTHQKLNVIEVPTQSEVTGTSPVVVNFDPKSLLTVRPHTGYQSMAGKTKLCPSERKHWLLIQKGCHTICQLEDYAPKMLMVLRPYTGYRSVVGKQQVHDIKSKHWLLAQVNRDPNDQVVEANPELSCEAEECSCDSPKLGTRLDRLVGNILDGTQLSQEFVNPPVNLSHVPLVKATESSDHLADESPQIAQEPDLKQPSEHQLVPTLEEKSKCDGSDSLHYGIWKWTEKKSAQKCRKSARGHPCLVSSSTHRETKIDQASQSVPQLHVTDGAEPTLKPERIVEFSQDKCTIQEEAITNHTSKLTEPWLSVTQANGTQSEFSQPSENTSGQSCMAQNVSSGQLKENHELNYSESDVLGNAINETCRPKETDVDSTPAVTQVQNNVPSSSDVFQEVVSISGPTVADCEGTCEGQVQGTVIEERQEKYSEAERKRSRHRSKNLKQRWSPRIFKRPKRLFKPTEKFLMHQLRKASKSRGKSADVFLKLVKADLARKLIEKSPKVELRKKAKSGKRQHVHVGQAGKFLTPEQLPGGDLKEPYACKGNKLHPLQKMVKCECLLVPPTKPKDLRQTQHGKASESKELEEEEVLQPSLQKGPERMAKRELKKVAELSSSVPEETHQRTEPSNLTGTVHKHIKSRHSSPLIRKTLRAKQEQATKNHALKTSKPQPDLAKLGEKEKAEEHTSSPFCNVKSGAYDQPHESHVSRISLSETRQKEKDTSLLHAVPAVQEIASFSVDAMELGEEVFTTSIQSRSQVLTNYTRKTLMMMRPYPAYRSVAGKSQSPCKFMGHWLLSQVKGRGKVKRNEEPEDTCTLETSENDELKPLEYQGKHGKKRWSLQKAERPKRLLKPTEKSLMHQLTKAAKSSRQSTKLPLEFDTTAQAGNLEPKVSSSSALSVQTSQVQQHGCKSVFVQPQEQVTSLQPDLPTTNLKDLVISSVKSEDPAILQRYLEEIPPVSQPQCPSTKGLSSRFHFSKVDGDTHKQAILAKQNRLHKVCLDLQVRCLSHAKVCEAKSPSLIPDSEVSISEESLTGEKDSMHSHAEVSSGSESQVANEMGTDETSYGTDAATSLHCVSPTKSEPNSKSVEESSVTSDGILCPGLIEKDENGSPEQQELEDKCLCRSSTEKDANVKSDVEECNKFVDIPEQLFSASDKNNTAATDECKITKGQQVKPHPKTKMRLRKKDKHFLFSRLGFKKNKRRAFHLVNNDKHSRGQNSLKLQTGVENKCPHKRRRRQQRANVFTPSNLLPTAASQKLSSALDSIPVPTPPTRGRPKKRKLHVSLDENFTPGDSISSPPRTGRKKELYLTPQPTANNPSSLQRPHKKSSRRTRLEESLDCVSSFLPSQSDRKQFVSSRDNENDDPEPPITNRITDGPPVALLASSPEHLPPSKRIKQLIPGYTCPDKEEFTLEEFCSLETLEEAVEMAAREARHEELKPHQSTSSVKKMKSSDSNLHKNPSSSSSKKSRAKRSSRSPEGSYWDCSVCTFRNKAEAFKCAMCDVRKGTSTRKPRLNAQLVAQQQAQQNLTPLTHVKSVKTASRGGPAQRKVGTSKKPRPRLKNIDRSTAMSTTVVVNNVPVIITEYKEKSHTRTTADSDEAPADRTNGNVNGL
ncbi:uncharacterized protein LOC110982070 [Acanthaster planci]|uniref:Uncharacterized protein LOC110982070 n=1 Tax=Acanthaster planci TaxID=133434 RepID=A0A8B7YTV6_ACAPL|nr:uncharacterized protein LOC110982070 [Acanthaster planci]